MTKTPDKFPKCFQSEWVSTGSRTIDNYQRFELTADADGFQIALENGPWQKDDLFGGMDYWPSHVIWSGNSNSISKLLMEVLRMTGLSQAELFSHLDEYFDERLGIEKPNLPEALEQLTDAHRIPAMPSPEMGSGTCYNGLELEHKGTEWIARIYSDVNDVPEIFHPSIWAAESYDELFAATDHYGSELSDYLPWSRDEFAKLVIASDSDWESRL
jgi:hypothetical protein